MQNLIKELTVKHSDRLIGRVELFKEQLKESEGLTRVESYTLNRKTPYKKDRVNQVIKRLGLISVKALNSEIESLGMIKNASDKLNNPLVITINFYRSSTWGYCPKGFDNYGNKTDSITGCGYDKESAASAQLLNQNLSILKRLCEKKNESAALSNRDLLGYGSGSGILPRFEGGVGIDCHVRILENVGYTVTKSGNNSTTVLIISEAVNA